MDKLPLFDISLEDIEQGMYKISLVDKPAIEDPILSTSMRLRKLRCFLMTKRKRL